MKNKTTALVGVALCFMLVVFYFSSRQKKIGTIDFTAKYKQTPPIEMAGFEQGEGWQGNFTYDNGKVLEGNTSLIFSSWYGKENSISRQKQFAVEGYTEGYLSLFIKNKDQLDALTSLTLTLTNEKNQKKVYPFSKLTTGWNRVKISIPNWKTITSLTLSINSRPEQITEVNLDRLWLQKNNDYRDDLDTKSDTSSLRAIGERIYFFSASDKTATYDFKQLQSFREGTLSVSIIPEHSNELSFDINGATARFSAKNPRTCVLTNTKKEMLRKVLSKTSFENNIYVFIKATVAPAKTKFSISNNGIDFEDCGEIGTKEKSVPQLLLNGSYLVDSYSFEY